MRRHEQKSYEKVEILAQIAEQSTNKSSKVNDHGWLVELKHPSSVFQVAATFKHGEKSQT